MCILQINFCANSFNRTQKSAFSQKFWKNCAKLTKIKNYDFLGQQKYAKIRNISTTHVTHSQFSEQIRKIHNYWHLRCKHSDNPSMSSSCWKVFYNLCDTHHLSLAFFFFLCVCVLFS